MAAVAPPFSTRVEPGPQSNSGHRNRSHSFGRVPPELAEGLRTGLLGNLIWLTVYVVSSRLQHSRAVDQPLVSLGLEAKSYLLFGRQYHGLVQGRQVDITFVRGRWGDSALNITVQVDLDTRAAIGQKRPLLDCRACPRLILSDPDLSHLEIYAQDEVWMQNLLAQSAAREALKRLMNDQASPGHREIYLQPGRIWFYAHPQEIAAAPFDLWIEDLIIVAESAEN